MARVGRGGWEGGLNVEERIFGGEDEGLDVPGLRPESRNEESRFEGDSEGIFGWDNARGFEGIKTSEVSSYLEKL
jgi:hypothetical protein